MADHPILGPHILELVLIWFHSMLNPLWLVDLLLLCNRSDESSTSAVRSDVNEDDVPEEVVENQADYGLNLLSRAANILDDLLD